MNQNGTHTISGRLKDLVFGTIALVLVGFMIIGMMTTMTWLLQGPAAS